MKPAEALVERADRGPSPGLGYVIRRLALAQAWQVSGGRAAPGSASYG